MYFKAVERHAPSAILRFEILEDTGTAPKQLVDAACQVIRRAESARRRTGDPNEEIDQVWCVFDVDEHPMILEACEQARANDVQLAISNPAIELWFLLHFQDQTAFIGRREALHELRKHIPHYEKRLESIDPLSERFRQAADRAQALAVRHDSNDTRFPDDNPSSGVFRLIHALGATY